ncbi:galactosyltransferase domain-containing protein [Ditylenchus destructor]|nr:galactosyltransferase domain-containing protein [Ditylenchus destructor]
MDDDTVADLSRLQYWIDTEMAPIQKLHPEILFGMVRWDDNKIQRDKKNRWYVSREDFPEDVYPPYVFGPFYLISSEGVAAMLNHTPEVKAFSVDDAFYTGVLAEKAGVIRVDVDYHFRLFRRIKLQENCDNSPGRPAQPFLIAACCYYNPKTLGKVYDRLRNVQCKNSVFKQSVWKDSHTSQVNRNQQNPSRAFHWSRRAHPI